MHLPLPITTGYILKQEILFPFQAASYTGTGNWICLFMFCFGTRTFDDRLAEGLCLNDTFTLNKSASFLSYVLNCTVSFDVVGEM